MTSAFELAESAARALREAGFPRPQGAIVLGSGFADATAGFAIEQSANCAELPGFPAAREAGHAGKALVAGIRGRTWLVFAGRIHAYEGHPLETVVHPVRVAARLGAREILFTCACGALRADLAPGSLVAVRDHLDLAGDNPLRGPHDERLGTRFPHLVGAYDPALRARLAAAAHACGLELRETVYARVGGPSYETPAEAAALARLGAGVVGMSLVPEVIAARQAGLRVAALALVTNRAAGLTGDGATHAEVLAAGQRAAPAVARLLARYASDPSSKSSKT